MAQFCRDAPAVVSQCAESDLGANGFVCVRVSEDLDKYLLSVVETASKRLVNKDLGF
jgi:hypothetical protein